MTEPRDEELAAAFGRFAGLVRDRAVAGLAHPDRRGSDNALRDIVAAVDGLLDQLDEEASGPFGRCDTCGARCDEHGCMRDRAHLAVGPDHRP